MDKNILQKLAENSEKYMQFETDRTITWCGMCGNFGVQNALKRALTLENISRNEVLFCYDIGCSGNGSDKIEGYTIHGLHGRVISLAAGAAIANSKIKVIAEAGDGATFSEGVNHLIHGIRNDYPIMFLHHNNQNYGLTTGQASACTLKGAKMNGAPYGVYEEPINPLQIVLSLNPSFVARVFSGDVSHMTDIFQEALKHKGFAFVEVLQSCPTYNRETPEEWYRERVKYIENKKDYDVKNIWDARKIVDDQEKEIYIGVLYRNEERENFLKSVPGRKGRGTELVDEVMRGVISD